MSSAVDNRTLRLWQAPIGKKAVMGLTGAVLFGFVLVHMAGNLQFFLGAGKLDAYGAALKATPPLLWGTRIVLLGAVVLHVTAALQLSALSKAARPVAYQKPGKRASTLANRTMLIGGLVLLAFIVFHLLHFTVGAVHPSFVEGKIHDNVVSGFRVVPVAVGYVVAMAALCFHLFHGVWSLTQSLGFNHPKYTPHIKTAATLFAVVVSVGFASLPIAVLVGVAQ
jgi:succinate dehydrogenase / fumarate reductase cytochrome b subunit